MNIEPISVAAIRGPRFPLSWGRDPELLKASIAAAGLATPLVLRAADKGYEIVCGARRLDVLIDLGASEVPARVLPAGMPDAEVLALALEENLGHRSLNDAERALAVNHLLTLLPGDRVIREWLARLGLPPRPGTLERFRSLMALGPDGLDGLAAGRLDPETGERLAAMPEPDRAAALDLLAALTPGLNKRREILTALEETARIRACPVPDLLALPEVAGVLSDERLNRPQKEARVRQALAIMRRPRLAVLEEERRALLAALDLPAGLRIVPPINFEGLEFTAELRFQDPESLRRAARALAALADDPRLARLVELG